MNRTASPCRRYAGSAPIFPALALVRLRADLNAADDDDRSAILAARQVSSDHVRALGRSVGLTLGPSDVVELQSHAQAVVRRAHLDLRDPSDAALASAGVAMRAAVADRLARRCHERGHGLAARALGTDHRFAGEQLPSRAEWRSLITERWRVLPLMRPVEVADWLAAQRGDGAVSGRVLADAA
jgi:hypothetical protein